MDNNATANIETERTPDLTISITIGYRDSINLDTTDNTQHIDYQWYVMFGSQELLCTSEFDAFQLKDKLKAFIQSN